MRSITPRNKKRSLPTKLIMSGIFLIMLALVSTLVVTAYFRDVKSPRSATAVYQTDKKNGPIPSYPVHQNITATIFWVGEGANDSNKFIHNRSSTWVEDWVGAFGGVDDPIKRCDNLPCGFVPKENPYYFALPYSDINEQGTHKSSITRVPWYDEKTIKSGDSVVKNRWIQVTFKQKTVYAQWEDAGPYGEDDADYVFGSARPAAKEAGLDLSPSAAGYLGIDGRDIVSWQFIEATDVPDGPWRTTITKD